MFAPLALATSVLLAFAGSFADAQLAGGVKIYGVNYDRQTKPDWFGDQKCKDYNTVVADMQAIAKIAQRVRVYALAEGGCSTSQVIDAAKAAGLKVALGIWTTGTLNINDELGKLGRLIDAGKIDSNIVGLHVGSEAIYRKDVTVDQAIGYLQSVRNYLKSRNINLRLTIADVVDSYYQAIDSNGVNKLLNAVDYVSINQFSFWEKVDVNLGMVTMLDRIRSIRVQAAKQGKEVLISETGWPSAGVDPLGRTSVASIANQRQFFSDFYQQATAQGLPYFWFVGFDATWRSQLSDTTPVEWYFGMLKDDGSRALKDSYANLDLNPRTLVTFQASNGGFLGETFNPNAMEQVSGVELVQQSNDKMTWFRYQWFYDAAKGQVRSVNSNRCLDAYQPTNGGIVHTYQCIDTERNQKWAYDATTQKIKHASHTDFCLHFDPSQNNKVMLWTCTDGNPNQMWVSTAQSAPTSAPTTSPPVADSSNVRLFTKVSTTFQQLIRSNSDVAIGTGASGAAGSEWVYDSASRTLQSANSNYCLDGYEPWNGGRVHVWQCSSTEKNQRWTYDPSTGQLKHATYTNYCLDFDVSANLLHLWSCISGNDNQVWRMVSAAAKGVRITAKDSSVVQFLSRDQIVVSANANRDDQSWFWNGAKGTFVSKSSGLCLDADQPYDGGRVHTWDCISGENNQKWSYANGYVKHAVHGLCLGYKSSSDKSLVLKTCSTSDTTQNFTLQNL